MCKPDPLRIAAKNSLRIEGEFAKIIQDMVDSLTDEDDDVKQEYLRLTAIKEDNLEKLAGIAEVKIKMRLIQKLKRNTLKILRSSTNKMILASVRIDVN